MRELQKYRIGLLALGLGTVALLVFVLAQSSVYKRDKVVNDSAYEIAEDINSYVRNKSAIPKKLEDATNNEIPEEITYKTVDNDKYEFCVTYKGASSGSSLNTQSILYGGLSGDYDGTSYDYESSYVPSSLYVSNYSWKKGQKCYTVKPYIRSTINRTPSFNSSSLDYLCEPDYEYADLYEKYCKDGKYTY